MCEQITSNCQATGITSLFRDYKVYRKTKQVGLYQEVVFLAKLIYMKKMGSVWLYACV